MTEYDEKLDNDLRITALIQAQQVTDDEKEVVKIARMFYAFLRNPVKKGHD